MALEPSLLDDVTPLKFEVEIPATLFDLPAEAVLQRVYIEANTRNQVLQISVIFEDGSTEVLDSFFFTDSQSVQEYTVATKRRWMAVRAENVGDGIIDIIEIFDIELDVYIPSVIMAAGPDPGV